MEPQNETTQTHDEQPKKRTSINTPAAIITAGVLISLALILGRGQGTVLQKNTNKNQKAVTEVTQPLQKVTLRSSDPVRGDAASADVVIIEYSDSDCPFCERFHNTMKEIYALPNINVAWAYRYFPLSIHPNAKNEAVALACVKELGGNDAFWSFLDTIIGVTLSPETSTSILTNLAKGVGVDSALFATCIAKPNVAQMIDDQASEGQSLGARGTPFSIAINTKTGEQVAIPGALPTEQVKQLIDGLLKK